MITNSHWSVSTIIWLDDRVNLKTILSCGRPWGSSNDRWEWTRGGIFGLFIVLLSIVAERCGILGFTESSTKTVWGRIIPGPSLDVFRGETPDAFLEGLRTGTSGAASTSSPKMGFYSGSIANQIRVFHWPIKPLIWNPTLVNDSL